ncbi:MAG: pirin family protein [Patescibacteria group bacterium]
MSLRTIKKTFRVQPTVEGAGVHLHRAFGYAEVPQLDPFLLLDDFSSKNPTDYAPGFPWHPHRGIETVTYMLVGEVHHQDSMGNKGVVGPGAVQWMTAGSGIIHQEMPDPSVVPITGFQLWVNLPREHKMMPPRYQDILPAQIPTALHDGARVKIIAGSWQGMTGPVSDLMVGPLYLDVSLDASKIFSCELPETDTAFIYVFEGTAAVALPQHQVTAGTAVLLTHGKKIEIHASGGATRFLVISGKPIGEPVAWYGPVVMNTQEELRDAFAELDAGTFVKK